MNVADMTDQEVVKEILSDSLASRVRKILHHSAARIEQTYGQAMGPSGIQVRRMELEDAAQIVDAVTAEVQQARSPKILELIAAGAREDRRRIRRELLEEIQDLRFELPQYVEGQPGSRIPTGMSTRMVLDEEDVCAALDRIIPEKD